MNIEKWFYKNTDSLKGKIAAVTGATGGIGRELCFYLAKLGASIILLSRNTEKTFDLEKSLKIHFPDVKIKHIYLNLEDFSSVKKACEELKNFEIDFLIHNAGVYNIPRHKCSTGYDNVFQTNFISPYYMTKELLPGIREKVAVVGSIAHNYSKIDVGDIDFSKRKSSAKVYGNSKRFLMFSMYELFLKKEKPLLSIVHPGITFTNITNHYPKFIFAVIKNPMKIIFMKPKKACLSIIQGLFEHCEYHTWTGPKFFNIWGIPKKKKLYTCSVSESKKIYEIAEKIYCNLKKYDIY